MNLAWYLSSWSFHWYKYCLYPVGICLNNGWKDSVISSLCDKFRHSAQFVKTFTHAVTHCRAALVNILVGKYFKSVMLLQDISWVFYCFLSEYTRFLPAYLLLLLISGQSIHRWARTHVFTVRKCQCLGTTFFKFLLPIYLRQ